MPPCLYLSAADLAAKIQSFLFPLRRSLLDRTEGNALDEVLLQERIYAEYGNG